MLLCCYYAAITVCWLYSRRGDVKRLSGIVVGKSRRDLIRDNNNNDNNNDNCKNSIFI